MNLTIKNKAIVELTALIEEWFYRFSEVGGFPHMPPDTAHLMAQQALQVIEIIAIAENELRDEGMLNED